MKLRPLLIDEKVKADIRRVVEYAESHPVTTAEIVRTMSNPDLAVGNNPAHSCVIPVGYRCVYSIEKQMVGMCRHLSISVIGGGAAPNPAAVEMLMSEFGFRGGISDADSVWSEEIEQRKVAINALQRVDAHVA